MDFSPTGPRGPNRNQPPAASGSDQEPVKRVSVEQKQIPQGQSLERRPLDEWKVDPCYATPVLTKPTTTTKDTYQGADAKERVLAMLAGMEPDVNSELIRRVSAERRAEMVERVARIQKTLGKQTVQKAFEAGTLLLDLEEKPPAFDVTLNYVMALALKIQTAQDDIRARINVDRGNVDVWKKGLRLFSRVQDAWHELYPIVVDICTHEPDAFETARAPLERTLSRESIDSGVGDLIDLEDPWDQPQPLPSPQPVSLPPAAEARISELERQLGDTLDHLRYERSMSDRLQDSQDKIADLMQANQQVNHQLNKELSRTVDSQKDEISSLQSTLDRVTEELSTTKENVTRQEERVADLEQQLHSKTREYDDLNNQYQALVESGAESQRQLDEQYDQNSSQYEQRVAELTEALSAAGQEKEQLQFELDESRQREQELDGKVQQLEREREEIDLKVTKLTEENEKLRNVYQDEEEKDSQIKTLQETVDEKQREKEEAVSERDEKIHQIQEELDKFTKKADVEKEEFAQALVEFDQGGREEFVKQLEAIESLKQQLSEKEAEYLQKEQEADEQYKETLSARDKSEESLREEIAKYKQNEITERENTEQIRNELAAKISELEELKQLFEDEKRALLDQHKNELEEQEKTIDDLKNQLKTLLESSEVDAELAKNQYKTELLSKGEELKSLFEENEKLNATINELVPKSELEKEQQLKQGAEERESQALGVISSLNAKIEEVQNELEEQKVLVSQLKEKESRLSELEIQSTELESKVEELTNSTATAEKERDSERDEVERLKAELGERELSVTALTSDKDNLQAENSALIESHKKQLDDRDALLLSERDGHKAAIEALERQLREQKEAFEKLLREKEDSHSGEIESLKSNLNASDQEKEKAHQEEVTRLQNAFESKRTELESSVAALKENIQKLEESHAKELTDKGEEFTQRFEQSRVELEKEKEELLKQHQDKLRKTGEIHEAQLKDQENQYNQLQEDTRQHLAEEYQKKLEDEKQPLIEDKRRLTSELAQEKKNLVSKEKDISEKTEQMQSLSNEVASLKQKIEQQQSQHVKDSESASQIQAELRKSLSELASQKNKVDKELTDLQAKLTETEDKRQKGITEAVKERKNLVKSLAELTKEKTDVEKKIDGLTKQLSEFEDTLSQKERTIEKLSKERNQLQDRASSLETELDVIKERKESSPSVAIQAEPDAEIMVQEFINGIEQKQSLSGSTSAVVSDFGEESLNDVDSVVMQSETLYRRPNSKGTGKELRIESMLENSFGRLKALNQSSNNPTSVDIAFQQAIKGIEQEKRLLDDELNQLVENELTLQEPDEPPSHSPLRQARIKQYDDFVSKLKSLHETFRSKASDKKGQDQQRAHQLSEAMGNYIGAVNFSAQMQKLRDSQFHELKNEYSQLPQGDVKTPEGKVQDIHTSLKEVMKHEDAEVRDYVAGAYVKEAAAEILNRGKEALSKVKEDGIREELVRFETCLKRLMPEELPLNMGAKLGSLGAEFILRKLNEAKRKLHEGYETTLPVLSDDDSGRSETGQVLAKRMIEHPDIRPMVLTLLTSLQETHEGVATDIDYYSASLVGLNRIRNEFGLVDMPTMEELLNYAVHDLKSQNSLLATEAQKRHGQSARDKQGVLRKDKLLQLCDGFLKKENSSDAPEFARVRGQSHDNGNLVVHPHREVLKYFQEGGQVFSKEHTRAPVTKGRLQVRELSGASGGLLNNFFEKASGGATQVTNDRASLQCIQIGSSNTQPEGIVFKYNARTECWQVNLGDALWNVDPAFILDNPNLKIPFEGKVAGVTHRDWIPLKSLSGETAILALRKVPKHGRYFLYQKGHGDTLIPKVIGASNPEKERIEAQFFYDAALASETRKDVPVSEQRVAVAEVKRLSGAAPCWLNKKLSEQQLQALFDQASLKVTKKPVRCPVQLKDVTSELSVMTLEDSPYRQIQKKKQSKAKAASSLDISPEHTGSKLAAFNAEWFGQFSVNATFEMVGQHYIDKCRENLKGSDALLEEELRAKEKFRREAFKELTVYRGCELKPNEIQDRARTDRGMVEGTPEYSRHILTKVTRVNRDHEMRLAQGLSAECDKLAKTVRENAVENDLSAYSDDELLDFMILEFEQGKIPQGLKEEAYIKQLAGIILARNDLEQSARLGTRLDRLMQNLEQLERDADLKAGTPEYVQNCQQWNLEMALLATEQDAIASRLDSYTTTTLDSGTRARMSFECRARTVLRENQVKEVSEALEQITDAMTTNSGKADEAKNGRMSRVSQLGTGWGKSTIVQPLTDHACAHNMGVVNRSVLVIAPESNQADLNITLGRYYAQKGLHYQVLDIENQYVNSARGQRWWSAENLDRIYITMMGGSSKTDMDNLVSRVNEPRAPVGVSVKNVQILMQLRNQLQHKEKLNKDDQASLQRLDRIADLVRESMVFLDEWDRTLMPPGADDLKDVVDGVNRALKPLGAKALEPENIMQCHGQMVQGCKRKHMLSATIGTGYTAAVAASVTNPEDIKEQCHTDVFTTQQRFWHWLNGATPVYVHLNQDGGREEMFRKVIDEVGADREMIVFDGNRKDGDSAAQAVNDYKLLSQERQGRGAKPRGVLYYDEKKQLHKYEKNDPVYGVGNGAILPKEEEDFIKANRGRDVDVVLTHRESIGTDAPQGPESVGIYMGLLEQVDNGRTSLAAQQMGRMMRASGDLRKPQDLYVVVNLDAIEQLPVNAHEKGQFKAAFEKESKALTQLAEQSGCTADSLKPELKALVYTPLQVPPQDGEDSVEAETLTERAVINEVNRLAETEWSQHGLKQGQLEALKSFKIQQWQTRKAYLLLTAAELARREVSHYTKSCEEALHKANVESHLDEVFADENAWLQRGMDGQISKCQLKVGEFEDDEIREITRRKIITAVGNELSSIPRRISSAGGDFSLINEQINPEAMSQEIKKRVNQLKENGIKTAQLQALNEPVYSMAAAGPMGVPTIREVLVSESSKAFSEALNITNEVIGKLSFSREKSAHKIRPIGIEQMYSLRDELQKKAQLIARSEQGSIDLAIKTREIIEHHYQELMRAISWVGFDSMTHSPISQCEKAFNAACDVMGKHAIEIPKGIKATSHGVGSRNWEQYQQDAHVIKLTESFLKKKSFQDSVQYRLKEEKNNGNKSTVYRLAWKKEQSVKGSSGQVEYRPTQISLDDITKVKKTAISNINDLENAVSAAQKATKLQQRSDEAMKLCQKAPGTNTTLYETCMDEVLQQLLNMYRNYSTNIQEHSRSEQDRIQQQTKLMQVPLH